MKKQLIRNKIKFVRFGDLSPIQHKKYVKNKPHNKSKNYEDWDAHLGFHSPPCRKGTYAFVYPYIERFLISAPSYSGLQSTHPKVQFIRDDYGNKISFDRETVWEESDQTLGDINLKSLTIPAQASRISQYFNRQGGFLKNHFLSENKNDGKMYLVKQIKPKIFTYEGDIWHHLDAFLETPAYIIERKGGWVKTDFAAYKEALKKALGRALYTTSRPAIKDSWDHLEVFIEKI